MSRNYFTKSDKLFNEGKYAKIEYCVTIIKWPLLTSGHLRCYNSKYYYPENAVEFLVPELEKNKKFNI